LSNSPPPSRRNTRATTRDIPPSRIPPSQRVYRPLVSLPIDNSPILVGTQEGHGQDSPAFSNEGNNGVSPIPKIGTAGQEDTSTEEDIPTARISFNVFQYTPTHPRATLENHNDAR